MSLNLSLFLVKVHVIDPDFMWSVPAEWSLEEASTVPVVYATAYYSLLMRGKLMPRESILIHAGAGGVGLAAIRIAVSRSCNIFVTVSSGEKRDFLLREFKDLRGDQVLLSARQEAAEGEGEEGRLKRQDFDLRLMSLTSGRGVDVILNCLSGDKQQAGLRCLASNGRFLEIGKVDFLANKELLLSQLQDNQSFHGILLDSLFASPSSPPLAAASTSGHVAPADRLRDERNLIKAFISEGIKSGEVRPLKRSIFPARKVEDAFRFLASGKHIGKVVIKIRDHTDDGEADDDIRSNERNAAVILKSTLFSGHKCYILIGGLGGFALQLVFWMIGKGARELLLVSRRGVSTSYQKYCLQRFASLSARVYLHTSDCSTEGKAQEVICMAAKLTGKPVGGIFSIATTYIDRLMSDQSVHSFTQVAASKIQPTIFLDRVSRQECPSLDHFVCFSSASCGRGNAGQTAYNYGNAVMEEVCRVRVRDGLHGLAIQWGVIGDVGVIAENSGMKSDVVLLGSRSQRMASVLREREREI